MGRLSAVHRLGRDENRHCRGDVHHGPRHRRLRWTDLPAWLFAFLEDAGFSPAPTDLHFSESFLLPGDQVMVVGITSVEMEPAGERSGLRDPPMKRRIIGTERTPVILRDVVDDAEQES